MAEIEHGPLVKNSAVPYWIRVILDIPLAGPFDYRWTCAIPAGTRVIVNFGRRKLIGVVVGNPEQPGYDFKLIKPIEQILDDTEPLASDWLRFAEFAADYYQRPLGEVVLPSLPAPLRRVAAYQGKRSNGGPVARPDARKPIKRVDQVVSIPPTLNDEQQRAVEAITAATSFKCFLLFGVTGSGKTEVYLHAAADILKRGLRVLLLVPEINLTPQFEQSLRQRLEPVAGPNGVAVLHSALSDGERLNAWLRVQRG